MRIIVFTFGADNNSNIDLLYKYEYLCEIMHNGKKLKFI